MRDAWTTDGDVRLFAREGGDGPALVFLHGGLADHRAVLPIVGGLTDSYRVILPDLRGGGRSWFSGIITFDALTQDLARLLDELDIPQAVVGGISSGTGPAVHFALQYPERTLGLVTVHPVYAGGDRGYTDGQARAFAAMDAVAGRAALDGIEVLKPLFYDRLPEGMRERAWQMAEGFDPASVTATSRFITSGTQPFESAEDLAAIRVPALIVPGDDEVHPAEVAGLYSESLEGAAVARTVGLDIGLAIRRFCDGLTAAQEKNHPR